MQQDDLRCSGWFAPLCPSQGVSSIDLGPSDEWPFSFSSVAPQLKDIKKRPLAVAKGHKVISVTDEVQCAMQDDCIAPFWG